MPNEPESMKSVLERWLANWSPNAREALAKDFVAAVRAEDEPGKTDKPDLGEPCSRKVGFVYSRDGMLYFGEKYDAWERRSVACVNALRGVRNPAAAARLIRHARDVALCDSSLSTIDWKTWVEEFDKEPTDAKP